MALNQQLRIVLVTPESTLLDEPVEALRFPLYDGQIGILPGRAPLVGRLGYGELQKAQRRHPKSDADFAEKAKELLRARRKLALARKAR